VRQTQTQTLKLKGTSDGKPARKPREAEILRHALGILQSEGYSGLTMRAVATASEISLSNVQYYFKDKNALLAAIVEDYFDACATFLTEATKKYARRHERKALNAFLIEVLSPNPYWEKMCATFREFWAVSTRNEDIAKLLASYYQRTADLFCDSLLQKIPSRKKRQQIALLVIPYIEGFTVTGPLSGQSVKATAALITTLVYDGIAEA